MFLNYFHKSSNLFAFYIVFLLSFVFLRIYFVRFYAFYFLIYSYSLFLPSFLLNVSFSTKRTRYLENIRG